MMKVMRACRPGRLDPARQQLVDARLRQIGFDREPAVAAFERHAAVDLDRHRPGDEAAEIEAEPRAAGLVERRRRRGLRRRPGRAPCGIRAAPECR